MAETRREKPARTRADARRNRERLVEVAARAFASGRERIPMDAIAREAGVGSGTLYRHFPTREDLVEAVYEDQVERLRAGAEELLREHPPARALALWMELFVDWAQTKHGMVDTLAAIVASGRIASGRMRAELVGIVAGFLAAGARAGDLRADVEAEDVAATLAGILAVAGAPEQRDRARRMLGLVVDGLRPVS